MQTSLGVTASRAIMLAGDLWRVTECNFLLKAESSQMRWLVELSGWVLNSFRDGDLTASLDKLFHSLATLAVKCFWFFFSCIWRDFPMFQLKSVASCAVIMPAWEGCGSPFSTSSHLVAADSGTMSPEPALCLGLSKHGLCAPAAPAVVVVVNWSCSSMSVSFFLFWGPQTWTQYSRCGLTSPRERGITPILDLLATPLLTQPADSCSESCPAQPPRSFLPNSFPSSHCPACTFPWDYSIPCAGLGIWQVLNKARVAKVILCFIFDVINKKFIQHYAVWS